MRIERRFTRAGKGPYEGLSFEQRVSEIRNPDGYHYNELGQVVLGDAVAEAVLGVVA